MRPSYWQYFLNIEVDLEATVRFVDPRRDNFKTYSSEFANILLSASSEVDVVCKVLAKEIDSNSDSRSITGHRSKILQKYPRFHEMKVIVPRYTLSFEPWLKWAVKDNPDWWKSYNNVKHKRHQHFAEANQFNAFQSVSGLFCLLLYLYHDEVINHSLDPWPRLLDIEINQNAIFPQDRYRLPDFNSHYYQSQ
jgi:hypothetical protein